MQTQNGTQTAAQQQLGGTTIQQPASIQPRQATPLVPTTLDDAWRMARALAQSTVIPKQYQGNEGNVFAAMMLAQELSITPLLAMRMVYFISDRPSLYAEMKIALVMREPECEYFQCIETDAKRATFETKRKGHTKPTSLTVRIEEIPERLRSKNENWTAYPANMLRWRCGGWLCDLVYPDKVLGMKTKEELEDINYMREVQGTRVEIDHSQVIAPPPQASGTAVAGKEVTPHSEPGAQAAELEQSSAPASQGSSAVQQEATPASAGAPDLAEVLLAEIPQAAKGDMDGILKRAAVVAPKGHQLRAKIGEAINLRKRELDRV